MTRRIKTREGDDMFRRMNETVRRGAVGGRSVVIYILLWLLGVPALWLVLLFLVGVGR
jgi:hypothetical protein